MLGGYGDGQKKKRELLISEGVVIVNGKIDLKKFEWKI
jgi:alkylated DNA nucleotide flippase Atl1